MKKLLLFASMAMLLAGCAVESRFGQVKDTYLSGCNTGTQDAPARVAPKALSPEEDDYLEDRHYVRVAALEDGSYFVLAQDQVNCCPKSVDAHLYVGDKGELNFCFEERLGIDQCDCMCPLRCEATLTGMEEGEYPVKIYHNGTLSYQTTITLAPGVDDIKMLD